MYFSKVIIFYLEWLVRGLNEVVYKTSSILSDTSAESVQCRSFSPLLLLLLLKEHELLCSKGTSLSRSLLSIFSAYISHNPHHNPKSIHYDCNFAGNETDLGEIFCSRVNQLVNGGVWI